MERLRPLARLFSRDSRANLMVGRDFMHGAYPQA